MSQLVRSKTPPNTVHQPLCKVKGKNCQPWEYAISRGLGEIIAETGEIPWLHLCKTCIGACYCAKCEPEAWSSS